MTEHKNDQKVVKLEIDETDIFSNKKFLIDSFIEMNQEHLALAVDNCHELNLFIKYVAVLARKLTILNTKRSYEILNDLSDLELIHINFIKCVMYVYNIDGQGIFYKNPYENELMLFTSKKFFSQGN